MVILKLTGEGYIFYKQQRIGKNGFHFGLLKFATMFKDSPIMKGGNITANNDPRILPFCKYLRKHKINELPQIINVLFGDMSIIGRRPTVREHFDFYDNVTKIVLSKFISIFYLSFCFSLSVIFLTPWRRFLKIN